jgi:pimeloyl-ACP methyl ester carboxylesterase/DNA-binding winged helix-turn-helix (wHTH) protein
MRTMIFRFGDFDLDTVLFELRESGKPQRLEPQVFDVLSFLVQNRDRLVTKDELLEEVWADKYISEAALNSRLMAARKAIGDSGREQRWIRTQHGRGFRFVGEVKVVEAESAPALAAEVGPVSSKPERAAGSEERQTIRFCETSDGVHIAYATVGEGPPVVKAPNWLTHLEYEWQNPVWRHWWQELARDFTVIRFDQRGSGLSDRLVEDLSFESWVTDLETVVDAANLSRFALLGISQGGAVAVEYTVRHPEKVSHLVLCGAYIRGWAKRGPTQEHEAVLTLMREGWGRDNPVYRQLFTQTFMPGATQEQIQWFNELQRVSTSAENAVRLRSAAGQIDILDRLPLVSVPALVLHARGDERVDFDEGRRIASLIPNARFVALDSRNHLTLEDEPAWPQLIAEVRSFLSSAPAQL